VVVEVEHEAIMLLGVYNKKEHKAFLDCYSHGSRINRCFYEMGVKYEAREAPLEPVKRRRGAGTVVTRHLAFQGPDIDPYLRYAHEVDVANLMTELGGMLGSSGAEGFVQAGTSAQARGFLEELEYFDVDGSFSRLVIHSCFCCASVLA
jgi:hypothetical protein